MPTNGLALSTRRTLATSALLALLPTLACAAPYGESGAPPKNGTAQRDVDSAGNTTSGRDDAETRAPGSPTHGNGGEGTASEARAPSDGCAAECRQAHPSADAINADGNACFATCSDDPCADRCHDTRSARCAVEAPAGECDALDLCLGACP
jgi:hypothetical protein